MKGDVSQSVYRLLLSLLSYLHCYCYSMLFSLPLPFLLSALTFCTVSIFLSLLNVMPSTIHLFPFLPSSLSPPSLFSFSLFLTIITLIPHRLYMQSKLSPEGMMMDVETEEGLARRYSMHFRVKAGKKGRGRDTVLCV